MSKNIEFDKENIKLYLDEFDNAAKGEVDGTQTHSWNYYIGFQDFLKSFRNTLIGEAKKEYLEKDMDSYKELVDDIAKVDLRIRLVDLGLYDIISYGRSLKISAFASSIQKLWQGKSNSEGENTSDNLVAVINKLSEIEKDVIMKLERYLNNFPVGEMGLVKKILGVDRSVGIDECEETLIDEYKNSEKSIDDTVNFDVKIRLCRHLEDYLNALCYQMEKLSQTLCVCSVYKKLTVEEGDNVAVCLGDISENMSIDVSHSKEFKSISSDCTRNVVNKKRTVIWHLKYGASALGISVILFAFASNLSEDTYFTSQFENFLGKIGLYLGSVGFLGISVNQTIKAIKSGIRCNDKEIGPRLPNRHR